MRRAKRTRAANRQSAFSAVSESTSAALIVAEALHASAAKDMPELIDAIAVELEAAWPVRASITVLTRESPRFSFAAR